MESKLKNKLSYISYLNPDYIYVPLVDEIEKKRVYKGDLISVINNKPYYSSVSGNIIGITDETYVKNTLTQCVIIKNDYMEKRRKNIPGVKYINDYSKSDLLDVIKSLNIIEDNMSKKFTRIVVNGIDKDQYEKTRSYLIINNSDRILETIDALNTIFNVKETILAINNRESSDVIHLLDNIGTYPNIKLKLLSNSYSIGYKSILINNLLNKQKVDEGFLYLTVEEVYNIYKALKRNVPPDVVYITLGGNAFDKTYIVETKRGVLVRDLINEFFHIKLKNYKIITNGLISGSECVNEYAVITKSIRSVFINTIDKSVEINCINCGLCNLKCPVGLNPKYIMEHKKADKSRCIKCGLCTYICPAKINFKKYLGDSDE